MFLQLDVFLFFDQDVSVLEQEKIDKLMLDMDGTENKCKLTFKELNYFQYSEQTY